MSETPANQFGISTDLSLFLWLHTSLCLSISAVAVFFKWMLLSPVCKKKKKKKQKLQISSWKIQNSGNLGFKWPFVLLIWTGESFGLE